MVMAMGFFSIMVVTLHILFSELQSTHLPASKHGNSSHPRSSLTRFAFRGSAAVFPVVSLVGDVGFVASVLNGFSSALNGDYVNATNNVVNVGVEEIVDSVKWAVVIGILSPFLAFAVALLKKVS